MRNLGAWLYVTFDGVVEAPENWVTCLTTGCSKSKPPTTQRHLDAPRRMPPPAPTTLSRASLRGFLIR
jgi:hypothetical protein